MLADSKIVGFIFTRDYDNARAFYEGKLGFQFVSQDQFALAVRAGAHMIRITKIPDFTPARATVLGWEVTGCRVNGCVAEGSRSDSRRLPFHSGSQARIWTAPGGRSHRMVQRTQTEMFYRWSQHT